MSHSACRDRGSGERSNPAITPMHSLPPEQRRPHRVVTWLSDEQRQLLHQVAASGSITASAALRQLLAIYGPKYRDSVTASAE